MFQSAVRSDLPKRDFADAPCRFSSTGRAMWQMIGVLAELERSFNSERTRAGVKEAKRRGLKFGRKVKFTPEQIDHVRKLIDKGEARQYMADLLNGGRSTLYRALTSGF